MVCAFCAFLRCPTIVCLTQPLVNQYKNTSMFIHDRGKRAHETTRPPGPNSLHDHVSSYNTTSQTVTKTRFHTVTRCGHITLRITRAHIARSSRISPACQCSTQPRPPLRSPTRRVSNGRMRTEHHTSTPQERTPFPVRQTPISNSPIHAASTPVHTQLGSEPKSPPSPEQAKTSPKRAHRLRLRSLVCGARSGLRVTECWRAMLISTRTPGT